MSFHHIDIESAMRRLADRRIEEAMREGKFDNLKGAGQPLDLEPMPANEDARLAWWAMRIFRQNDYTPEEVRWRKQLDALREQIDTASSERKIKALVTAHNQLVHQINTLGTTALKAAVAPLSLERELRKLRERHLATLPPWKCSTHGCRCLNPAIARFCRRCGIPVSA